MSLSRSVFPLALIAVLCAPPLFATTFPAGFGEVVVARDLDEPTAFVFAPDGRIFVVEKAGRVRLIKDEELVQEPVTTIAVTSNLERGLIGMAIDPDFPDNGFLYVYYTTSAQSCPASECGATPDPSESHAVPRGLPDIRNRVSRLTIVGDRVVEGSERILVDDIPSDSGRHNGGGLEFGPDGKLYVSTGDGGSRAISSQDLASLAGKILRINPDGTIPPDNPFAGRVRYRNEIWCYGLRNPWRFTFDSVGRLFIGDVGASKFEEVDVGEMGFDYGWPNVEGFGSDNNGEFEPPVYDYPHPASGSSAIILGVFATLGGPYPTADQQLLFFGDVGQGFIEALQYDELTRTARVFAFATGAGTPVDFGRAPDGTIWYLSLNDGELRQIVYDAPDQ